MQTYEDFKKELGVTKLDFYKSSKSDSAIGSVGTTTYATAKVLDWDQPCFVYPIETSVNGVTKVIHYVTNKEKRAADFSR